MVSKPRLIYLSQFLSAWGDRMWNFAVAIFLMDLAPDSLLLPAVFGLTLAAAVLMFGPLVGDWIDRTPRLRAAQVSLITQNTSVAACAIILLIEKLSLVGDSGFLMFVKIIAIFLGMIARLASVASSIIIQKDWIVVIADGNEAVLAGLNSVLRRIDLCTKLLAPLVCGQVITLVSLTFGCGFVAGWNVFSMFIEYFLLRVVYMRTPDLAHKKKTTVVPKKDEALLKKPVKSEGVPDEDDEETRRKAESPHEESLGKSGDKAEKRVSFCGRIFGFLFRIPKGWKCYMSQSVAKAGIGLSCLYMTVLGFDAITTSYAYSQCFSEVLIGILLGASGLTGIVATFLYSPLSAQFGVVKAGLMASAAQVLTLIPCVLSVFVVGSPFLLLPQNQNIVKAQTTGMPPIDGTSFNSTTSRLNQTAYGGSVFLKCIEGIDPPPSYLSLSLLMSGIVLARVGLWGFDLAVTQLYQQRVSESERGVVGGVQSSLNYLMDLLHFILVIVLPKPSQFGFLVMVSAFSVTAGHFLYAMFAWRELKKESAARE